MTTTKQTTAEKFATAWAESVRTNSPLDEMGIDLLADTKNRVGVFPDGSAVVLLYITSETGFAGAAVVAKASEADARAALAANI